MAHGARSEVESSALHPPIGAAVRGLDLSTPIDEEAVAQIGML